MRPPGRSLASSNFNLDACRLCRRWTRQVAIATAEAGLSNIMLGWDSGLWGVSVEIRLQRICTTPIQSVDEG